MSGLETIAAIAGGASLVGAKGAMLAGGTQLGASYHEFIANMAKGYEAKAVDTPGLYLPDAPKLNVPAATDPLALRAPRAPRSSSGGMVTNIPGYTSTNNVPKYTSDAFNSTIMGALDKLYSSNSMVSDDPNFGKIIGADLAPTEFANYAKGDVSSTVSRMQDISTWDIDKLNELGNTADFEDIRNMVYFGTTDSFTQDRVQAIQKNLLGINNFDMAERSTAKRYGVTVDEYKQFKTGISSMTPGSSLSQELLPIIDRLKQGGAKYLDGVSTTGRISKSAIVDILSYENALSDGSQKFNQFTAALSEAQRSGQKYFSFNISGNKAVYGKVGSGGLERQAAQVVNDIASVAGNQQTLISQQQQAAELERQNAENAIYNQLTRSRNRRGY